MTLTLVAGVVATLAGAGLIGWLLFGHAEATDEPSPTQPPTPPRSKPAAQPPAAVPTRQQALLSMTAPRATQTPLQPDALLSFYRWWQARTYDERSAPRYDGAIPGFPSARYLLSFAQVRGRQIQLFDGDDRQLADFTVASDAACTPLPIIETPNGRYDIDLDSTSGSTVAYRDDDQSYTWSSDQNLSTGSGITSDSLLTAVVVSEILDSDRQPSVERSYDPVPSSPSDNSDSSAPLATAY